MLLPDADQGVDARVEAVDGSTCLLPGDNLLSCALCFHLVSQTAWILYMHVC